MGEPIALSPDPADEAQSANPQCIYWRSLDPEAWPFFSAVVSFFTLSSITAERPCILVILRSLTGHGMLPAVPSRQTTDRHLDGRTK